MYNCYKYVCSCKNNSSYPVHKGEEWGIVVNVYWMARGKEEIKQKKKIKAIQENGVVSDKTYPPKCNKNDFIFLFFTTLNIL